MTAVYQTNKNEQLTYINKKTLVMPKQAYHKHTEAIVICNQVIHCSALQLSRIRQKLIRQSYRIFQ